MDGARSAIVIVIDRLGAGYLPPYGSTWVETPALNRLASQALLCEHAIVDCPDLDAACRSFWQGGHVLCEAKGSSPPLPERLANEKIQTALFTDDEHVADHVLAESFAEQIALSPPPVDEAAEEVEQTQFAQLITAALDWLQRTHEPFLLWLHARGMNGPWDAPQDFRAQLAEEDDPPPPAFTAPPDYTLSQDYDPDELLGLVQAYAGQLAAIDMCLGVLFDAIEQCCPQALVALTGSRGYPLGEHRGVGAAGDALFGESLHVPMMVKLPPQHGAALRSQAIVQPADLYATLLAWHGAAQLSGWCRSLLPLVEGNTTQPFDRAASAFAGARSLRTPAWFYCEHNDGRQSLYRKPDDRWEVNEVANRCPGIVDLCAAALEQFEQAAKEGDRNRLAPLSEELVYGIE